MDQSYEKVTAQVKTQMENMYKIIFDCVQEQQTSSSDCKFIVNRIERMYSRIKIDVARHEVVAFELAQKFE
jgi:hypothetical protein